MAAGPGRGWLMRMLFKSSLTVAVVAALFAATWAVCEQLVGLGTGTSLAMAGVLLAILVSGLAFWALCRPQVLRPGQWPREWDVRSHTLPPIGAARWLSGLPHGRARSAHSVVLTSACASVISAGDFSGVVAGVVLIIVVPSPPSISSGSGGLLPRRHSSRH
jgi:hypothetical protein